MDISLEEHCCILQWAEQCSPKIPIYPEPQNVTAVLWILNIPQRPVCQRLAL
jgi:hypothetical protein